ncbi:uncharacterized protein TNCV_3381171 [Trichonephila clavipes]|nr:uncharacterized protein TNCV_3381171 [Trichonephila clavipes]
MLKTQVGSCSILEKAHFANASLCAVFAGKSSWHDCNLYGYSWRIRRRILRTDDGGKPNRLAASRALLAAVAEWYRYRTVACFVTGSSPVPLKTRRVGQRCTLNLSRAETSSRWCGVVVRRGGCQLRCRPRHLTMVQNYVVRRQKPSCS